MPGRFSQHCARHKSTEALARGELDGAERLATQAHLEECEDCRTLFRNATAEEFPRLHNYTILERIGEGGFGAVYKVIHHAKQRTEALKMLSGKTAVRQRYFQDEVHLVAKLRHPNIATLYEAHLSPPLFFTMDLVEGRQLDDYFSQHQVPLVERIKLVKKVAAAVGYAHAQGVVHRDIKPQNIVVDADGEPHIIDFGIGKKLGLSDVEGDERPTGREGALGTFGYMAPEQSAGADVDARADVYALGVLLYHCVTGEPAKFATWPERLAQILHERRITRADDLAAIIHRCVQQVPEQRYSSCEGLVDDLENYLAGRSPLARPHPTAAYQAVRAAAYLLRNRPFLVRTFIVILVAAILAPLARRAEARWSVAGADTQPTALIVFSPGTEEAIRTGRIGAGLPELSPTRDKSWRMLQGRLMEHLAAAKPSAVIWDSYYPDCHPEYDGYFIGGMRSLQSEGVPVVVGVEDLDRNGEPEGCRHILAAADRCGVIASAAPDSRLDAWVVPVCVRRGLARAVPGLAAAGYAAARYPDADLEVETRGQTVALRYRKRSVQGKELRWYEDRFSCARVDTVRENDTLQSGDHAYQIYVPIAGGGAETRRIPVEDVLLADAARLKTWFCGRAVLVGFEFPGLDEHLLLTGETVFGCHVHADALRSMLSGSMPVVFDRPALALAIMLWAVAAAALGSLAPCSRTLSLRVTGWVCVLVFVGGLLLAITSHWITDFWRVHLTLGCAALLCTGGLTYMAKAVRQRQMQLAPESSWSPDSNTLASTLLATASDSNRTDGQRSQESGSQRSGTAPDPAAVGDRENA